MTESHSSVESLWDMRLRRMPALLTRMSTVPNSRTAVSMISRAPASVATEAVQASALPPRARISSTTWLATLVSAPEPSRATPRSLTTTRAPRAASCRAMLRPMPRPEPVTTATRPSSTTSLIGNPAAAGARLSRQCHQLALDDLAGRVHRQLCREQHDLRAFVGGDAGRAPVQHVVLGQRLPWFRNDERADALAQPAVRRPHDRHGAHPRVTGDGFLHLAWYDVDASGDDQVLSPLDHANAAIRVHDGEIAAERPAVAELSLIHI